MEQALYSSWVQAATPEPHLSTEEGKAHLPGHSLELPGPYVATPLLCAQMWVVPHNTKFLKSMIQWICYIILSSKKDLAPYPSCPPEKNQWKYIIHLFITTKFPYYDKGQPFFLQNTLKHNLQLHKN